MSKLNMTKQICAAALMFHGWTVSFAQTITATCNPSLLTTYKYNRGDYLPPGPAGVNQSWVFTPSSIKKFDVIFSFNHDSGVENPNAGTVFVDDVNACAVDVSATGIICWVERLYGTLPSILKTYTNAETWLTYPFAFGDTFTDQWLNTYTISGVPHRETGTSTVTADGSGTLTVGTTIYTNVLRVHRRRVYRDSVVNGIAPAVTFTADIHAWYKPDVRMDLLTISSLMSSVTSPTASLRFRDEKIVVNGLQQTERPQVRIQPNPAVEFVHVTLDNPGQGCEIVLTDYCGRLVRQCQFSGDEVKLPVADLPAGIYTLRVLTRDGNQLSEKLCITR